MWYCHTIPTDLSVDIYNGAEKSPRSALSVDVQHAQYLQEPYASVTATANKLTVTHTVL